MPISGARTPGADSSALTPASAHTHRAPRRALLYAHHADLVLSGHVHAYERTHAVFDGCRDECGPIYLNLLTSLGMLRFICQLVTCTF